MSSTKLRSRVVIRAKAPLRISFGGGGTDVPPYCVEKGGCVISGTMRKYAFCTLVPNRDEQIRAHSLDLNAQLTCPPGQIPAYDGNLDLIKGALKVMGVSDGFDLRLHGDVPPGTGLGSSSAMCVALLGALKRWQNEPYTDYELADLAYRVERLEVGIKGGKQDQYACTFGGFNFIEFQGNDVIVSPLRFKQELINEMEYRCILCDTGRARLSAGIINDQMGRYSQGKHDTIDALDKTKEIAIALRNLLLQGRVDEFGWMLNEAWLLKKRFTPLISNGSIDQLYEIGRQAGALGGKLLGAGGGGYLLFICAYDRRHTVIQKLEEVGAKVSGVAFEPDGLQAWETTFQEEGAWSEQQKLRSAA